MKIDPFNIVEFVPATDCYIGSALIGGIGSVASGLIGASASKSAADAQAQAQQRSIDFQQQMYNSNKELALPYINAGTNMMPALQGWIDPSSASSPLASLLRLTTPGADMSTALSQTPGFQFTQQYGMKGINNALAARGLAGPGGPLARAGADYSAGLASNTWDSVVKNLLATFQGGAGPLQNLVNTGASSAAVLSGVGATTGQSIGNNMVGVGNAQAAGTLGAAGAIGGAVNNLGQYGMLANLLRNNNGGGASNGVYGGGSSPFATSADAGMPWGGMNGSGGFNFMDAAAG